jgi:hypothetical protein
MNSTTPKRSLIITVLAVFVLIAGAVVSLISIISAMMFMAGSYGTKNADPFEALIVIAGPPFCAVTGFGLLLRKRWAWFCMVGILFAVLVWQASEIAFQPPAEDRTFISPSGVRTTVTGNPPQYSIPIIATAIAMLALLLSRKSRAEFSVARTAESKASVAANATPRDDLAENWRVGHTGRDTMYYEELCGGEWRRIPIDGEMLMGRAHHVICFASPQTWLLYPEWARHRRDEIIARIKSRFREPEYEYTDGGTAYAAQPPVHSQTVYPPATPSQKRAVWVAALILICLTGGMGWLVKTGIETGSIRLPAKHTRTTIVRDKEPALFWVSVGTYSALGLGSLGLAAWIIRCSRK